MEWADESQRTQAPSPIPKQSYWERRVGKRKEFWFFKPVEDSADVWGNRKRNTARDPNTCRSFVHSKTPLYAYNRTSLQLRPAK